MRASPHSAIQWILPLSVYRQRQLGGLERRHIYHGFRRIYRRSGGALPADYDTRLYHPFGAAPHCLGRHLDVSVARPWKLTTPAPLDGVAMFVGRVTMMLIALVVAVMMYEVILRYVFERPTLWANEMSLWLAGFVFILAGFYAMQQRSHIRIYLLYDMMPRGFQKACDTISTVLIVVFAFFLVYGGYGEAKAKLLRWETFGTAFDPPIPATLKPLVLAVVTMVAIQAILNLIKDWNLEPVVHTAADDIDQDEIERLKKSVGDV